MDWLTGITLLLLLLLEGQEARRYGRDLGELVEEYDYNRLLLENIPRPYFVVFPTQLRNKASVAISTRDHRLRHHGTHEHLKHVVIQLLLKGTKVKIKLQRNEVLLSSGISVKHFKASNQEVISKTVEHCYYHGQVKKDEWSSVAVSTCHGIRGVVQMQNETYVIQPLIGGDEGMEHPHVLYKATVSKEEKCGNTAGLWLPFHELHKGEFIKRLKFLKAQRHDLGIESDTPKVLRVGLVLDKFMYMGLNFSQQLVSGYAMEIMNIVDLYYRDLGFHIALSYLEYWNVADRFIVSTQQRELLEKFQNYKNSFLPKDAFDVAFFLTGLTLDDNSVGMAIPDSVCSDRSVGIVKSGKPFEPQQTAASLAHMVAHTLGIDHDEDAQWRNLYHQGGCDCTDAYGCIMSIKVLRRNNLHSRMFSTCSQSDLDVSVSMGITSCLQGAPLVSSQFTQTCGNSIVERGEECDCGSAEDCEASDPCCDPHTCLLKYWAQCRSGPCCANCTVLDSSHMCRDRQSECDVPEYCDGETGNCPFNTYIEDGHPCASGSGYCLGGICPTLDQQCVGIWGPEAEGGSQQCYQRFNPTGNFNGHCGKDRNTGNYAKCDQENILCGLLHCSGGLTEPLYGSDKGFSKTTVSSHGVEYQCKTVHGPALMDMPHMGLVQDGTRCSDGHICRNRQCVPLPAAPQLDCPATNATTVCSGHGVCAPDDTCFCKEGWTGLGCEEVANVTTPAPTAPVALTTDSEPTPLVKVVPIPLDDLEKQTTPINEEVAAAPITAASPGFSTTLLIIILATVIGGLVLVLGITLICYRRRTPLKHGNGSSGKDAEKNSKFGKKRSGKKKKWMSSEDESELGELPPPPVIISDPNSLMPEKGILKNSCPKLTMLGGKRGSDSGGSQGGRGSDSGASYVDQDSFGPYMYDEDEDAEAAEIREIFREQAVGNSLENLDSMPESASFDFVIPPPPPPQFHLQSIFPSPPIGQQLDPHCRQDLEPQPLMWRTPLPPQTLSPPQSRIVKLRNFSDLMARFDKTMVDLSPSPDEPPVQLSPSTCTSEDVRSSETEPDRMYYRASHSDHSPTSVASSSTTQHTLNNGRPSFGNLSQYKLKHNNLNAVSGDGFPDISGREMEEPSPHPVHMPPPMNPINIRSILGLGHNNSNTGTATSRDSNETPQGSQGGDSGSLTGNSTLKGVCGYEKSSGYGSEHDPGERFSVDDNSHHSRSQSTSPPSYSAVIRTGPNQIQLVPPGRLLNGCKESGSQEELQRLLEGLPRIDAGSFERSPLQSATPGTPCTGPIPPTRPLPRDLPEDPSNTPCIDRSLEEIPQVFGEEEKKPRSRRSLMKKSKRPISLCVNHKGSSAESQSSSQETVQEVNGKKLST